MAKDPAAQRRLAMALRENLKRRKVQARGRAQPPRVDSDADSGGSAHQAPGRVGLSPQSDGEGNKQ